MIKQFEEAKKICILDYGVFLIYFCFLHLSYAVKWYKRQTVTVFYKEAGNTYFVNCCFC